MTVSLHGGHLISSLSSVGVATSHLDSGRFGTALPRGRCLGNFGPNELMEPIHDRMPVILDEDDWPKWLGEEPSNDNELKALLKPFASDRMTAWPVGNEVGNVRNTGAELIERAAIQSSQI